MTGWLTKRLGDFCETRLGKMLDKKMRSGLHLRPYLRNVNVQWGYFGLSDVLEMDFDPQERKTFQLRIGDLLVCEGGEVGRAAVWRGELDECYYQKAVHRVRPDQNICIPDYLYLYFRKLAQSGGLREFTTHSTIAHLTGVKLRSITVPLPPLDEQRRIVDILNRANGIVRLRLEALDKTRQLIPALFVDMFGDPVTNPKGWGTKTLGELGKLDRGRSRHRPRNDPRLLGGPYPFIQTGDVANSGGQITQYSSTYSELGLAQSKMWPRGTLCITIAANIARTGVLMFDSCFPDSVVGFKPGPDASSFYIQSALDLFQTRLEMLAPQLAQKNINLRILRALEMPVPSLRLQEAFASRVTDIPATIAQQERMAEASEQLVAALMAGLFDGAPAKPDALTASA